MKWIKQNNSFSEKDIQIEDVSNQWGLVAIQGPKSFELVEHVLNTPLNDMKKFEWKQVLFQKEMLMVSRTGYTGENGVEIFTPLNIVQALWKKFFQHQHEASLKPIGLVARNTLRLEMKYPLYGQDMDETITPTEMNLTWACKNKHSFIGKKILSQKPKKKDGLVLKSISPLVFHEKAMQ